MNKVEIIVFDVERGLCVFLRTPSSHGILIDCGRSAEFSPVRWLINNRASLLTPHNGRALTKLIISHPHDDHVEDIDNLISFFPPAILRRQKDYSWDKLRNMMAPKPSSNTRRYHIWQQSYNQPATEPNYGCHIQCFGLTPQEAFAVSSSDSSALNNASLVTVLTWQSMPNCRWKVVVAGDNETEGWEELLKNHMFVESVRNADFFITSHHGHKSGFSTALMKTINPLCNITSERYGDQSVAGQYCHFARGITYKDVLRRHLTTRTDGSLSIVLRENVYKISSIEVAPVRRFSIW